jgi:hypothetical protein
VRQDVVDILRGDCANPGISEQQSTVVEREARREGIEIGQEGQEDEATCRGCPRIRQRDSRLNRCPPEWCADSRFSFSVADDAILIQDIAPLARSDENPGRQLERT